MALNKIVVLINWVNNTDPAINDTHLNQMDQELDALDDRVISMEGMCETQAENAEAWAKGTRGGEAVGSSDPAFHNNAYYWASQAKIQAENAEAWAKGTRGGTAVASGDPAYQHNSYYYSTLAAASSTSAASSAGSAETYASRAAASSNNAALSSEDSEAYAVGTRNGVPVGPGDPAFNNNAYYWATQAHASQVQADFNQNDSSQVDYIKNKPNMSTYQPKTLATPITVGGTSQTTVEGALGAVNTDKQSKTLSSSITVAGTSQTTVEGALGAINTMAAGKATTATYTATIPTISGSSATVSVNGIEAGDNPIVDINFSGSESSSTISDTIAAWSKVWRITTQANQITVYVTEATTVTIPIQLKVVR